MDIDEKYKILINARNFHYENFNKWMTYFYVAIGALFLGFCTITISDKLNADEAKRNTLEYTISILGYIVGLLWYWSCKGYYYWNINFITLVNYYEETILRFPVKERIYFVFANKEEQNKYYNPISGANISTSKVAILFAFIVTCTWGFIPFYKILTLTNYFGNWLIPISILSSVISVIIISCIIPNSFLKSKIVDFTDLKIKHNSTMNIILPKIKIGNDEFILYMRKNGRGSNITNDQLGKMIWNWIKDNANGTKIEERSDEPCRWGVNANNIDEYNLPKTATQFEFDRIFLPELYSYLDSIV